MKTVLNKNGDLINYDAAVELMDNDLREKLHAELAPCTNQVFFERYCEEHEALFDEEFAPATTSGQW